MSCSRGLHHACRADGCLNDRKARRATAGNDRTPPDATILGCMPAGVGISAKVGKIPDLRAAYSLRRVSLKTRDLNAADVKLLAVGEHGQVGATGHRADANDHVHVGQRASSQAQEPALIETRFQRVGLQGQHEAKAVLDVFEHLALDPSHGLCEEVAVECDHLGDIGDGVLRQAGYLRGKEHVTWGVQ